MMTRKQIDTSREIRLWTTGIVLPVVTTVALLAANPEVRDWTKDKFVRGKTWVKSLFKGKKKEEKLKIEHKTVEIKNQQTIDMLKRVNKIEGS